MLIKNAITEFLERKTNKLVFGMSGANIEELYESFSQATLNITIAKNENNAVAMAIGAFLKTQKISTIATTSGGALLNTIPMLAEAYTSRLPCLVIAGMPQHAQIGLGAFQETSGLNNTINIENLLAPITCKTSLIDDSRSIMQELSDSIEIALQEKRPAVILIPSNFWRAEVTQAEIEPQFIKELESDSTQEKVIQSYFSDLDLTKKDENLIVYGTEINSITNSKDLAELLNMKEIPFMGTPESKGFLNHSSPYFRGLIGVMESNNALTKIKEAKNIIFIGVKKNLMESFGLSLIHI